MEIKRLALPWTFLLIGIILVIYSFNINDLVTERLYRIGIWTESINDSSVTHLDNVRFYYRFSDNVGSFRFTSPNKDLNGVRLDLPSTIKNGNIWIYNFTICDLNYERVCNRTVIDNATVMKFDAPIVGLFPLPEVDRSKVFIYLNRTIKARENVLVEFELEDFKPSGMFHFEIPGPPTDIYADSDSLLVFDLGRDYECIDCFFLNSGVKKGFWNGERVIRVDIPIENQTDSQGNYFRMTTRSKREQNNKSLFMNLGISLIASMIAILASTQNWGIERKRSN